MDFEKHAFGIGFITGLFLSYLDIQLAHYLQSLLWQVWSLEMNEADFTDLVKAVEALAEPNRAEIYLVFISGIAATLTLIAIFITSYQAFKAWQQAQRSNDLEDDRILFESIKEFYSDAFNLIFDPINNRPENNRNDWYLAAKFIDKAKAHKTFKTNIFIKKNEIEEEKWQVKFKAYIEQGDPKKNTLRMQFFTGLKEWESNNDSMKGLMISKRVNIGSSFSEFDAFGNTDKNTGISNIAIENIITVYTFMLGYEEIEVEDLKKIWIDEPEKHKHTWPKDNCRGFHRFFLDYFEITKPE